MHTSDDRLTCVPLGSAVFNKLSSFTYGPLRLGSAIGRWDPVMTVNYPIKKEVRIGVSTTESNSSEISASESFTASMETGVSFWGASSKFSLSSTYEKSFKNTVN